MTLNSSMSSVPRFVFFGTPRFSEIILDELASAGHLPVLVVTAPDKPKGRGLVMTPSEVSAWALRHAIPCIAPEKLSDETVLAALRDAKADVFVVAAYGKILKQEILDLPPRGVLNVHPSLLPKFRGSSPIESFLLSDEPHTGVSIMLLDAEMDHGPIVAQRERVMVDRYPKGSALTDDLAHFGGALLAEILPAWTAGDMHANAQDHARATYTKKIAKADGLIDPDGDPLLALKKIRAFDEWPGAYFFAERGGKQMRIRITEAHLEGGKLAIDRVVPEGKNEMPYADFLRGMR